MSESFKEETRISKTCFTRDRKLPFKELVVFLLRGAYKTLSVELESFLGNLSKEGASLSKQAVSKARRKIKHTGFVKINNTIVEEYYKESHKTFKGYRILAADGSMIELPMEKEITKAFGKMNNNDSWVNCGWSMTIHDVLNNIIVDSYLHPYGSSERSYLMHQLTSMHEEGKQRKDIIIADRGLPSLPLFVGMKQKGYDFVIRYNGEQFLKEFNEFAHSNETGKVVTVSLTKMGKRQKNGELKKLLQTGAEEEILVRIVKIKLPSGEIEYLATSVLDEKELSLTDLKNIYSLRWAIEEGFKSLKNTIELENFSGKSKETVLQDYYSKIAIYNLHSLVVQEAQEELDEKVKLSAKLFKYKKYQINRNVSYGLVREKITELFSSDVGDWEETFEYLVQKVQKSPIPERLGRKNERQRKWPNKFPGNKRRAI